jgi:Ca2+-dependent lipid-binding protein
MDSGGTSDPFATVNVKGQACVGLSTQVIKKTLEPHWDEKFSLQLKPWSQYVRVEIKDKVRKR